jgi:hypothetical protein
MCLFKLLLYKYEALSYSCIEALSYFKRMCLFKLLVYEYEALSYQCRGP